MPFTQFTSLDFDQIKAQIKDYLRANTDFSDFDFEGSNFSVLIDTLAYNTYINSFNANLIANESFLDSAQIRENVVSLARNIGYIPRSRSAATASIYFDVPTDSTEPILYLKPGLVCVGSANNTTYRFSITQPLHASINNGVASFGSAESPVEVYQGTSLSIQFLADSSIDDQRFLLQNPNIDISSIKVFVSGPADTGIGREYKMIDNILNLDKNSEVFFVQEVQDEKYELLFGDGYFGKKLENNTILTVRYIITDGAGSNGASQFAFQGSFSNKDPNSEPNINTIIPTAGITINTVNPATNGSEAENVSSIKYFAPRLYSAQYRAVTPRDYEAIIQSIYPRTESVAVIGGEELTPPQFGKVQISIKPKNGTYVSDFDKHQIKNKLKSYAIAGINSEIIDLKILYVEIDSSIYYDSSRVSNDVDLRSKILGGLTKYSQTVDINKFGGRFKYSKILQLIDRIDSAITSNITKLKIRRDLKVLLNQFTQYELCFGNKFHINPEGFNIKSTGFTLSGSNDTVFITDVPNKKADGTLDGSGKGVLSVITRNQKEELKVVAKSAGTVDYTKGEVILNTLNITSTVAANNLVEIQAFPDSNDVVGLKDLYLSFDVSNSKINMVKDVIASGEDVSGVVFTRDYYTSSYSNGDLERK
tara:strand:- start:12615 stop:14561 length:1947 start_codon:yes stop_codon:yes gene_type:complete